MKTKFVILLLLFLISCRKDKNTGFPNHSGELGEAGLIPDFELWEPPASAIHIDPTNIGDIQADGSTEHPYSSFNDVTWHDDSVYVLKRGTVLKSTQIVINASNVTIATYGNGDRPLILCTDNSSEQGNRYALISEWNGINNIIIRDLEITAPEANSCIRFLSNCYNMQVINCKLHDSYWGLRSISNNKLYVYNTEVYNTNDDGMYILDNTEIEISHCYVHHVNLNWKPPSTPESDAPGDGIQFSDCNHWWVHHNVIDRSGSGNKFCFISNNENQNDGIVEYNSFTGPEFSGACVYFHNGSNIIVRYNYFLAPSISPVYSHASGNLIYGNIFYKVSGPVLASKDAKVFNNIFYRMPLCIQGDKIEAVNNVFDSEEGSYIFHVDNLSGSNNLFVTGEPTEGSFNGEPWFIDPENGDFHISSNSDCIDKGINVGIDKDMDGNTIPYGDAPDIGVFEYTE